MNQLTNTMTYQYIKHSYLSCMIVTLFLMLSINVIASDKVEYKITSPISGVVKHVYVTAGKIVKKGDLLLEFDNTLIASNLSEAQANVKLAKLNRAEAKKELDRAEELYERTVLSEHDLQLAKVLYAKAEAQSSSAENKLVHAQWDVKHSKLYAAFNGQVSQIFSYSGQYVNNQFSAETLLIIKDNQAQ